MTKEATTLSLKEIEDDKKSREDLLIELAEITRKEGRAVSLDTTNDNETKRLVHILVLEGYLESEKHPGYTLTRKGWKKGSKAALKRAREELAESADQG